MHKILLLSTALSFGLCSSLFAVRDMTMDEYRKLSDHGGVVVDRKAHQPYKPRRVDPRQVKKGPTWFEETLERDMENGNYSGLLETLKRPVDTKRRATRTELEAFAKGVAHLANVSEGTSEIDGMPLGQWFGDNPTINQVTTARVFYALMKEKNRGYDADGVLKCVIDTYPTKHAKRHINIDRLIDMAKTHLLTEDKKEEAISKFIQSLPNDAYGETRKREIKTELKEGKLMLDVSSLGFEHADSVKKMSWLKSFSVMHDTGGLFQKTASKLPNIQHFALYDSPLHSHDIFTKWKKLQVVTLKKCGLDKIPESLMKTPASTFDLSENFIQGVSTDWTKKINSDGFHMNLSDNYLGIFKVPDQTKNQIIKANKYMFDHELESLKDLRKITVNNTNDYRNYGISNTTPNVSFKTLNEAYKRNNPISVNTEYFATYGMDSTEAPPVPLTDSEKKSNITILKKTLDVMTTALSHFTQEMIADFNNKKTIWLSRLTSSTNYALVEYDGKLKTGKESYVRQLFYIFNTMNEKINAAEQKDKHNKDSKKTEYKKVIEELVIPLVMFETFSSCPTGQIEALGKVSAFLQGKKNTSTNKVGSGTARKLISDFDNSRSFFFNQRIGSQKSYGIIKTINEADRQKNTSHRNNYEDREDEWNMVTLPILIAMAEKIGIQKPQIPDMYYYEDHYNSSYGSLFKTYYEKYFTPKMLMDTVLRHMQTFDDFKKFTRECEKQDPDFDTDKFITQFGAIEAIKAYLMTKNNNGELPKDWWKGIFTCNPDTFDKLMNGDVLVSDMTFGLKDEMFATQNQEDGTYTPAKLSSETINKLKEITEDNYPILTEYGTLLLLQSGALSEDFNESKTSHTALILQSSEVLAEINKKIKTNDEKIAALEAFEAIETELPREEGETLIEHAKKIIEFSGIRITISKKKGEIKNDVEEFTIKKNTTEEDFKKNLIEVNKKRAIPLNEGQIRALTAAFKKTLTLTDKQKTSIKNSAKKPIKSIDTTEGSQDLTFNTYEQNRRKIEDENQNLEILKKKAESIEKEKTKKENALRAIIDDRIKKNPFTPSLSVFDYAPTRPTQAAPQPPMKKPLTNWYFVEGVFFDGDTHTMIGKLNEEQRLKKVADRTWGKAIEKGTIEIHIDPNDPKKIKARIKGENWWINVDPI